MARFKAVMEGAKDALAAFANGGAPKIEPGDEVKLNTSPAGTAFGLRRGDTFYVNGLFGPSWTTRPPGEVMAWNVYPLVVLDQDGALHRWNEGKRRWDEAGTVFPARKRAVA